MQTSRGKYDDEPSGKFSATSPNDLSREQKSPKCGHQIIDTRLETLVFFVMISFISHFGCAMLSIDLIIDLTMSSYLVILVSIIFA